MGTNILHFSGRLAAAPELAGNGDKARCKFRLIANEYAGKDDGGAVKERTVALPFTAFRAKAEAIAKHARKGDQLIVTARIENNNFEHQGEERFDYNFIVDDFEFGAPGAESREVLASRS